MKFHASNNILPFGHRLSQHKNDKLC